MTATYVSPALKALASKISEFTSLTTSHRDQSSMPEWTGAGVVISSHPPLAEKLDHPVFASGLVVMTGHARALTWLLLELRDTFGDEVDFSNKFAFYGGLAEVARSHLEKNQPESSDPRPLLYAVFAQALHWSSETDLVLEVVEDDSGGAPIDSPEGARADSRWEGPLFGRN